MTVARLAISFDPELAREVRRSAGREPVSAWLADAARRKLRAEGLLDVVRDWESLHGEISDEERRTVDRKLRSARSRRKRKR
jgi:hypothetical protein